MNEQFEKDMSLEVRSKEVGGSEASIIMGMSHWKTPLELWQEKRGLVEPEPQTIPMAVGHVMEPLVADLYKEHLGEEIGLIEPDKFTHEDYEWMIGHLDRVVIKPKDFKYGLECKTANPFNVRDWGEQGTDEVPKPYYVQVMHYMGVTNLPYFDIAVLIGNNDFRIYRVYKNDQIIDAIIDKELEFMEWVNTGTEPPIDAAESTRKYLLSKYPKHKDTEIIVADDDQVMEHILAFREATKNIKKYEQIKKFSKNQIMQFMGHHSKLICSKGSITWKKNKDSEKVDWKGICLGFEVPDSLIKKYTIIRPGARVFRPNFK